MGTPCPAGKPKMCREVSLARPAYIGMSSRAAPSASSPEPSVPTFLTVEEAAAVLRVGRTAAYLLAKRWEATAGAEGLPVVRFGRLLRVPLGELERLAGGPIHLADRFPIDDHLTVPESASRRASDSRAPSRRPSDRKRPARRRPSDTQPTLFPEAS